MTTAGTHFRATSRRAIVPKRAAAPARVSMQRMPISRLAGVWPWRQATSDHTDQPTPTVSTMSTRSSAWALARRRRLDIAREVGGAARVGLAATIVADGTTGGGTFTGLGT